MGKREELRLLRSQTSADAPINYHHRTGDSEGSAGSMLDVYAQVQSVEYDLLEEEDREAQGVFVRAFKLYLKQTLTGKERKFLNAVMSGKGKPHEIGRALKINWFDCLQEIRRKAFANAEAFKRVATLSGWSRAEAFSEVIFRRVRDMGGEPIEEESRERKRTKARAMLNAFGSIGGEERRTDKSYREKIYRQAHKAHYKALHKAWRDRQKAAGISVHKRECEQKYRSTEKWKAVKRRANKKWEEKNAEKVKAYQAEYAKKNAEKMKAYQAEYRAKKKAEKLAAQALAGLLTISQADALAIESSL